MRRLGSLTCGRMLDVQPEGSSYNVESSVFVFWFYRACCDKDSLERASQRQNIDVVLHLCSTLHWHPIASVQGRMADQQRGSQYLPRPYKADGPESASKAASREPIHNIQGTSTHRPTCWFRTADAKDRHFVRGEPNATSSQERVLHSDRTSTSTTSAARA